MRQLRDGDLLSCKRLVVHFVLDRDVSARCGFIVLRRLSQGFLLDQSRRRSFSCMSGLSLWNFVGCSRRRLNRVCILLGGNLFPGGGLRVCCLHRGIIPGKLGRFELRKLPNWSISSVTGNRGLYRLRPWSLHFHCWWDVLLRLLGRNLSNKRWRFKLRGMRRRRVLFSYWRVCLN